VQKYWKISEAISTASVKEFWKITEVINTAVLKNTGRLPT
jgi:hypothetical protein